MSSALAIAAVSAVLKDVLNNGLIDHDWAANVGPVTVTALPPDRVAPDGTNPQNQLNLFLYQVSPNLGWRNADLPSRDSEGERIRNPPLALDLHYLLTAYGRQDFHAEILLGYAMQLLHETAVLTRAAIRDSLNPVGMLPGLGLPANSQLLSTAGLAEQVEQIKICPLYLSLEDLSKLWTAFQTHYRTTTAYQVTVVLIQSRLPTRSALPVRERKLYVIPFRQPSITAVEPQMVEYSAGAALTVRGMNLRAPNTTVQFAALEAAPDPSLSTDERLVVTLPAGMRAGINPVQVIQRLEMGAPTLHRGFESNVAAFVLRPRILKKAVPSGSGPPEDDIQVVGMPALGNRPPMATVTVKIAPEVGKTQQVALLLNEIVPSGQEAPARVYRFDAPSREQDPQETTNEIVFSTRGVLPGDYLVRVQIDGAQSPLEMDATQLFTGPRITIG